MLNGIAEHIAQQLSTKVRVMTVRQIAKYFYSLMKNPTECAYRVIRKLKKLGFGESWPASATHLEMTSSIFDWDPDQPFSYSAQAIAWQNTKRWQKSQLERTVCITSTEKTRAHFGGNCRRPRNRELEHDINVTGIYLNLLHSSPELARTWQHEDSLPYNNDTRPDATIVDTDGALVMLDLLGRGYSADKISGIISRHRNYRVRLY